MSRTFSFVVLPHFNLMSFTGVIEALRVANRLSGNQLYSWEVIWREKGLVPASNGISIAPDHDYEGASQSDYLFVCASFAFADFKDKRTLTFLCRQARHGAVMGGIGAGAFILARAGLLDGYRSTIHWENRPAFLEHFPSLDVTTSLYEIDRGRITCSGGAASLDMMVHLISLDHGPELALQVSNQLLLDRMRTSEDHQGMVEKIRIGQSSPELAQAVQIMEGNLETPLTIGELTSKLRLTQRQLERLFQRAFAMSPKAYYTALQLKHGRRLLTETSHSILEIAIACGFNSQSYFARRYQEHFGRTPTEDRKSPFGRNPGEGPISSSYTRPR